MSGRRSRGSIELSLLLTAGQALAQAMVKSGWEALKNRIVGAFRRDQNDRDALARELERFRGQLEAEHLDQVRLAEQWQRWLQERLSREPEDVARAVLNAATQSVVVGGNSKVHIGHGTQIPGDVVVQMSPSHLARHIRVGLLQSGAADPGEFTAIVLLTDGESNTGLTAAQFRPPAALAGVPIIPIVFGSAKESDMDALAALTHGRVFDGRSGSLTTAFCAIRGYQ